MSLQLNRKETHSAVLEGRFIQMVLQENAKDIDAAVKEKTASFNSAVWSNRNFSVKGTTLEYENRKQFRFLDMKTRKTKTGTINKESYSIHNRPIFGHLPNIIRNLNFGFTDAVREELLQLDKIKL